ncbi:alpha/beta hydrolase fold domain-containing protein [Paracoccus sp. TOH]|uniref:alpha/beta hydrolase fold domain-containing protein n=1 Tax=Paracoccus sp. TOH TaxID=1263728 RepID=UPI0025B05255|nr:alpha/beta hydrolase fold domain-containing protein [Paracoccus sp. TOH]WJS86800.1 alpha/beta hydrolase [Paracoccus sp. TOH]
MIRDPQVLDFIARTEAAYPPEANSASAADNRRFYDAMCAVFRASRPPGLPVRDRRIGGVPCRVYGAETPVAVVYVHGGGFVVGGLDSHDDVCAEIADATDLQVVAVDYRLAPEHRWPAQIADVQAVWDALARPAVIAGDSAGGRLAAALCLSRRGARQPLGQVLVYPGLGGDGSAPSYRENAEAPLLRTEDLAGYHAALHGEGVGEGPADPLARPLLAASLAGLAPAFVVTADVDPLRDDGRDYARRLRAEGVAAHWRNEPELPHGYLRARRHSDRARRSFQAILVAIRHFADRA